MLEYRQLREFTKALHGMYSAKWVFRTDHLKWSTRDESSQEHFLWKRLPMVMTVLDNASFKSLLQSIQQSGA